MIAVLVLLMFGGALRAVRLNDPFVEFHSTRQHHSALLARKYEQALGGSAAGVDRAVVIAAAPAEIELPIMEAVTAVGWRLIGHEAKWFPRALSILAWSVGGWMLFLLMRRLASPLAGIVGVAVWSLLPFSIAATRAFQPDPLMVVAIVGAVLALVVHDDAPTRRRLVIAGVAGGFALLVKMPAGFFIAPVFLALRWRKVGWRAMWSRATLVYALLCLGPTILYNAYGFWIGGFLEGQDGGRIVPGLLLTARFWKQWLYIVLHNVGPVIPAAALVGVLVARRRSRSVAAALVAGYVCFGLAFTVHYSTHSYYHLPGVLVLAMGCGLLAERLVPLVRESWGGVRSIAVAAVAVVMVLIGANFGPYTLLPPTIPDWVLRSEVEVPKEVDELLPDATGVIFLARSFGMSLMFNGGMAGQYWDEGPDGSGAVLAKFDEMTRSNEATYFVITDMAAWKNQPDLQAFLGSRYRLIESTDEFLVYDLRVAAEGTD